MDKATLFSYMPRYYKNSKVIDNINAANSSELTLFKERLDNTLNQFFVDTADFTLERYESELGLVVNNELDLDIRRSKIKSKLRGQGTITIKLIKNVSESFTNGQVDVIENNSSYSFTIKFVSTRGIPPNLQDLKNSIEEIKPAHLAVVYEFTYTTWAEVKNLTWAQVKTDTWDNLKTRKVAI